MSVSQNERPAVGEVKWADGIKYRWNGWVWVRVGWEHDLGW